MLALTDDLAKLFKMHTGSHIPHKTGIRIDRQSDFIGDITLIVFT